MKNNEHNIIREGRVQKLHRTLPTDILVIRKVGEHNSEKQSQRPQRKRRINYAQKISNDPLIFCA